MVGYENFFSNASDRKLWTWINVSQTTSLKLFMGQSEVSALSAGWSAGGNHHWVDSVISEDSLSNNVLIAPQTWYLIQSKYVVKFE